MKQCALFKPARVAKILKNKNTQEFLHIKTYKGPTMNEEELRKQFVYDVFFERLRDGALLVHRDGYISDANENMCRLIGYDLEELVGKNLFDLTTRGNFDDFRKPFTKLKSSKPHGLFKSHLILKNEEIIPVELDCLFIGVDDAGNFLVVCYDFSNVMVVQNNSVDRDDMYRFMIDKGPEGFVVVDHQGIITDVSHAFLELFGYTRERLIGAHQSVIMGQEPPLQKRTPLHDMLFNADLITANGKHIPVKVKACNGVNNIGLDTTMLFIYIMEEYHVLVEYMERERQLMEKILAAITNQGETGVIIYRVGEGIRYANEYIANKLGYTKNELEEKIYKDIIDADDFENAVDQGMDFLVENRHSFSSNVHLVTKEGKLLQADMQTSKKTDSNGIELVVMEINNLIEKKEKAEQSEGKPDVEQLNSKFINNKSGVIIGKPGSGIFYVNDIARVAFGYEAGEMEKIQAVDFIHKKDLKTNVAQIVQIYSGLKKTSQITSQYLCKDGTVIMADVTITKQKLKSQKLIIMQFDNIRELAPVEA